MQGLLADVRGPSGAILARSGDPDWSVCATGRDYDAGGPGDAEVADWLARGDRGEGPSRGWVARGSTGRARLAVGERNDSEEGDFPLVCGAAGHSDSPVGELRLDARTPRRRAPPGCGSPWGMGIPSARRSPSS
jgi:hypothetical protein